MDGLPQLGTDWMSYKRTVDFLSHPSVLQKADFSHWWTQIVARKAFWYFYSRTHWGSSSHSVAANWVCHSSCWKVDFILYFSVFLLEGEPFHLCTCLFFSLTVGTFCSSKSCALLVEFIKKNVTTKTNSVMLLRCVLPPCRLDVIQMKMWRFSLWTLSGNCPWNFWRRASWPTSDSRKTFWGLLSISWKRTGKETSGTFICECVLMFLIPCRSVGAKHNACTVALSSYYFWAVAHMAADSPPPHPQPL